MALTVTKTEAKTKAKEALKVEQEVVTQTDPELMSVEELADLYGSLEDQISALETNPIYNQFAIVKKELMSRISAEAEPEDVVDIKGTHWLLEITACAKNSRKVKDIPLIQKFMGAETFAKVAKVNISDLEKYLTPEQVAKVVDDDTGYSSSRKVTAKFLG